MIFLQSLSGCAKHLFPVEDNDVVPPASSSNKCGGCNSVSSIIPHRMPLIAFKCSFHATCHCLASIIDEVGFTLLSYLVMHDDYYDFCPKI